MRSIKVDNKLDGTAENAGEERPLAQPVDAALVWRKSTFCADGTCVEVAEDGDAVLMRDSKDLGRGHLRFDRAAWRDFTDAITNGEFRPR